ncbi:MAG: carboxypeptidase-like regulatory domain-containing protein [Candidatus Rokuibacteriota bacterium]
MIVRTALRPALALLGALLLAGAAAATHAPDHRFVVLGVVTDADGRPLAGVPVVVTRLRTGLPYRTKTERDGFYLVVVHLHDEDEGDRLAVSANGVTGELVARYDVRDKRVERGTRVDVRGGQVVEDRRAFAETLRAYLNR